MYALHGKHVNDHWLNGIISYIPMLNSIARILYRNIKCCVEPKAASEGRYAALGQWYFLDFQMQNMYFCDDECFIHNNIHTTYIKFTYINVIQLNLIESTFCHCT